MDYQQLASLRQHHPAWRLLCSPHAPLIDRATLLERQGPISAATPTSAV